MVILPRRTRLSDPDLRDRLYELLEHDHLPYSVGSRFVRLIVCIIIIDVLAMILASVPEYDARFGGLLTAIKVGAAGVFALEYAARLWSVAGHSLRAGLATSAPSPENPKLPLPAITRRVPWPGHSAGITP